MNFNTSAQHQAVLAWGVASAANVQPAVDLRRHAAFSFTFEVFEDVVNEAVFQFGSAPPSADDPCVPDPLFVAVNDVVMCSASWGFVPPRTEIVIPAGTPAGSYCTATLPCKPDAFINVQPVSGDVGMMRVIVVLSGPR